MDKKEFEKLQKKVTSVKLKDLKNKNDRTLLYGFTFKRDTVHVYLQNKRFYLKYYSYDKTLDVFKDYGTTFVPDEFLKDIGYNLKRLYPETCDYEFCNILQDFEIYLCFTIFQEQREYEQYYGEIE